MHERDVWTARLSEYVDGDLAADERVALERHLGECAECRETVADLRRLVGLAGTLAHREPPRDLWPGIQRRIAESGQAAGVLPFRRRWAFTVPQLAAAAVVMMVVGAGSATLALRGRGTPAPIGAPVAVGSATVQQAAFAGTASYDAAIADLEHVLAEHGSQLDSATVRVLRQSLSTIDRAIAQARAALAADPGDPYLNAHLAETMRRKLNLMRRAATMVAAS
jgi:anti-sigma factor RsiW